MTPTNSSCTHSPRIGPSVQRTDMSIHRHGRVNSDANRRHDELFVSTVAALGASVAAQMSPWDSASMRDRSSRRSR